MDDFKQVVDFLLNDAALKEFAQNVRLQNGNDSKAIDLASLKKKLKDFKARLDKNEKLPETKKDDIPECFIKSFKDSYNQAIIAMEIILLATGCDESQLQKYKNNVFSGNESLDSTAEEDDDDNGSENPYLIMASIGLSDTPENTVIDLQDAAPVSEEAALTKFEENKLDNANTSLDDEEQQRLSDLFGKAVFPKIITELKSLALYMEEALAKAKTQTDKYQAKEKQYLTSYCVKCFLEWLYINKNKGFNVDYIIKNLLKRISEEADNEQFAYLLNKEYLIGAANYYNTKTGDEIVPGASPRKFDDWARNGMNYSKAYTEETHKELMVFGITRFRAL